MDATLSESLDRSFKVTIANECFGGKKLLPRCQDDGSDNVYKTVSHTETNFGDVFEGDLI